MVVTAAAPPSAYTTVEYGHRIRYGFANQATVFAAVVTALLTLLLCWWSIPFTVVGIVLGQTVSRSSLLHLM